MVRKPRAPSSRLIWSLNSIGSTPMETCESFTNMTPSETTSCASGSGVDVVVVEGPAVVVDPSPQAATTMVNIATTAAVHARSERRGSLLRTSEGWISVPMR